MTEKTPFDDLAEQYDLLFTRSLTGMAQRKIVWRYLRRRIFPGIEILEVNCGTGEDAIYLSGLDCRVTATDASAGMILQCLSKVQIISSTDVPVFKQAAINELDTLIGGKKFDLIFSNFSGLNCLNREEMRDAAERFHSFLKPGGRLIFVVFGTKCLCEKLYFLVKGRRKEMNRRSSKNPVYVPLVNSGIQIYYYSPAEVRKYFGGFFRITRTRPVGLFIPPTYLDPFLMRRKIFFRILSFADRLAGLFSFFSNLADHYLIEFRKS